MSNACCRSAVPLLFGAGGLRRQGLHKCDGLTEPCFERVIRRRSAWSSFRSCSRSNLTAASNNSSPARLGKACRGVDSDAVGTDGNQDLGCVCGMCGGLSAPIARAA
jgi:hypothetical protein